MEEQNKNPNPNENENGNPAPAGNPGASNDGNPNPSNDPSNKEGGNQGNPPASEDPNKPGEPQSKQEDAKFAKERHERDIRKAKAAGDAEGYKRARIKSVGGKNPYTDTPIETDEDFEFYELQDEVKSNGGDPKNPWEVEKLRREKAEKARKEAEDNRTEQEKQDAKAAQEVKDYLDEGHTQQELQEYWKNPKFMEFADGLLGAIPLKSIIAKFDKAYPKEDPAAKQQAANKASNPGSASSLEDPAPKKKISEMSDEEFKKYVDEVEKGKRKIDD